MSADATAIDTSVPPSGTGCVECLDSGGWWVHLRRCALCGHVGCCDTSPSQHASAHARDSGHPLAPPTSRPDDQPVPAPRDVLPENWRDLIH
jgi:hypothetical protein